LAPGRRKEGVKTGASDSAWLRDVLDRAEGDVARLLFVSEDNDLRAALAAWQYAEPLTRSLKDLLATLFVVTVDSGAATPVLLRVSPGIDSATHAAIATGGATSKFGVPIGQVPQAIARMREVAAIDLQGLHAHIGSQILVLEQFEAEVAALAGLERFGVYDVGGGLGVRYVPEDAAPGTDDYAARMVAAVHRHLGSDIDLIVEPGRSLVAPAGITVYRVVTVKQAGRRHVAVDGGMGDNLEHSLYGQRFAPMVVGRWSDETVVADLVGRHCESGDVITPDVALTSPHVGDLVAVPVTGAYCFTMANNYNAALRPPVIFCGDGAARLAVRRETYADLVAREIGFAGGAD